MGGEGRATHSFGDKARRLAQLGRVPPAWRTGDRGAGRRAAAGHGHAEGDAVRGEHQPGAGLGRGGQPGQGVGHGGGERLDEARVVEVRADLVDPQCLAGPRGPGPPAACAPATARSMSSRYWRQAE